MSEQESAERPTDPAAAPADAHPRATWFAALTRLWLLLPIRSAPRGSPILAASIMGAAWLAFWAAADRREIQPDPQFFVDGIPLLAWYGLAIVGQAALLRWRCRSPGAPGFAEVLALSVGTVPAPLLLFTIGGDYLSSSWFGVAAAAVAVYLFIYLARALHGVTGEPQRAAALTGLLFIAGFIGITDELNAIPDVWTAAETQAAAPVDAADDGEAILFGQSVLIDQALEAMDDDVRPRGGTASQSGSDADPRAGAASKSREAGKPRAFFLGFAGVGDQKVFAQEIGLASRVLGERYGIDGRALSLINDERDLEHSPLATVSGLRYALGGLASRMNLDRDVLFLAISSHGSSDPAIAVSNAQLPLQDLTQEDLADALRESGIKWRVIIISACYAGAFIDSLRDPQTIVITAAAADRTSFGCSNDRDLTYFGEAFYRDALPDARTLREAFDAAKTAIAAREKAENVTASDPQAEFGEEMEARLAVLEKR